MESLSYRRADNLAHPAFKRHAGFRANLPSPAEAGFAKAGGRGARSRLPPSACVNKCARWYQAATAARRSPARAWEALEIADIDGVTVRLHWTDKPYVWHVNEGAEVFVVLDDEVDMHYREEGASLVLP